MDTNAATTDLHAKAQALRALHHGPSALVLPNAWDAASARAVVRAGFPVVATTSNGVAASLGWPDGEQAPVDEMLDAVARIARAVSAPVTADAEGGYGYPPDRLVALLLEAGAVGCNIEDTDHSGEAPLQVMEIQAEYIAGIRAASEAIGVPIVVNARVDVFIREVGDPSERVAETRRRATAYREAGADCLFPIGINDEEEIRAVVKGGDMPVNIWIRPGMSLRQLEQLGVARISFGGALHKGSMDDLSRRLTAIRAGEWSLG